MNARAESIEADAIEAEIPDWVWEMRSCRACGCTVAKDDLDEDGLCASCGPEWRRLEAGRI